MPSFDQFVPDASFANVPTNFSSDSAWEWDLSQLSQQNIPQMDIQLPSDFTVAPVNWDANYDPNLYQDAWYL
jgi:hypothetical protein